MEKGKEGNLGHSLKTHFEHAHEIRVSSLNSFVLTHTLKKVHTPPSLQIHLKTHTIIACPPRPSPQCMLSRAGGQVTLSSVRRGDISCVPCCYSTNVQG